MACSSQSDTSSTPSAISSIAMACRKDWHSHCTSICRGNACNTLGTRRCPGAGSINRESTATQSRMTNGSVSLRGAVQAPSRMTNGVVQKGNGTTLVVRYQNGAQTISVPANVTVLNIVPGEVELVAGETAYPTTHKQADSTLTPHSILAISW